MSVKRIFMVIACFLCSLCLCGQAPNSLKDELSKVEYLLRSGELKLADELASTILLNESKAADGGRSSDHHWGGFAGGYATGRPFG